MVGFVRLLLRPTASRKLSKDFLRELLEPFFPDAAARLDFDSVRFLNKELFYRHRSNSKAMKALVARPEVVGCLTSPTVSPSTSPCRRVSTLKTGM